MFGKLENRYCLLGTLEFSSAVHVGSGSQEENTDMPVVRNGDGRPFIPGSSLRGVMRSFVERTLAGLASGRGCILFDEQSHPDCPSAGGKETIERAIESEGLDRALEVMMSPIPVKGKLCDVCRLFGSPFMASKLKISDLQLEGTSSTSMRHGVGIDRDTGRARNGVKYDFEVLEAQAAKTKFHLSIIGENLDATDLALLAIAWKQMDRVLTVGGKAGIGLGRCKPVLTKVKYFNSIATLKAYLLSEGDGYAEKTGQQMIDEWNRHLRSYIGGVNDVTRQH